MNQVFKINLLGFAWTAMSLAASSAMMSGCGQPPATRVTMAGAPSTQWPQFPPGGPGQNNAPPAALESFNTAQINSILGTYGGTYRGDDGNGNSVVQAYTVTLSRIATPGQPGKTSMQASFSGGNIRLQGLLQISAQPNGSGTSYVLYTPAQIIASINPYTPVTLELALVVSSSNQVDAASEFPISIGFGGSSQNAVDFYNDWARQ